MTKIEDWHIRELLVAMLFCGGTPSDSDMTRIYVHNDAIPGGVLPEALRRGYVSGEVGSREVTEAGKAFVREMSDD